MRIFLAIATAVLCVAAVSNTADAKKYEWSAEMPNYSVQISEPIGNIPEQSPGFYRAAQAGDKAAALVAVAKTGGRLSREETYAENIDMGFRLFEQIRNTQDQFHWVVVKLEPSDVNGRYDGELAKVGFQLKDGKSVLPARIYTTAYNKEAAEAGRASSVPVIDLLAEFPLYSDMRSVVRGEDEWYAYLAFPREFSAGDIKKPMLYTSSSSAELQPK